MSARSSSKPPRDRKKGPKLHRNLLPPCRQGGNGLSPKYGRYPSWDFGSNGTGRLWYGEGDLVSWGNVLNSRMPPNRPGASSLGGLGAQPTRPSGAPAAASGTATGNSSRQVSGRPPTLMMVFLILNLLVPVTTIAAFGFSSEVPQHLLGVMFGMFVSVVLLGLFRQALNKRRGDGRFTDWRISSTTLSTLVSISAWMLGAVNLFVVCLEISRRFT
jgi:hypothetical protein